MHDRISSNIPGLYPTAASNTHPPLVIDIQNIPLLGRGAKPPPLRTTVVEGDTKPFTDGDTVCSLENDTEYTGLSPSPNPKD